MAGGSGGGPGPLVPRCVRANNPSPLTLDGTRTYLVGRRHVAIIDPGPALPAHLDAVAEEVGDAAAAAILVTHGHPDHAGGAAALAERLGAPVRAAAAGTLAPGDTVPTDEGDVVAVPTPGHTPDHYAFHWPAARAAFVGDLLTGGLDTALVAAPEGDLGAYLESLARVRALRAERLYPGHGPPFDDPAAALDAYLRHREERLRQVLEALAVEPHTADELVAAVYGPALGPALREAARGAVVAYLEHLRRDGRVHRAPGGYWTRA